MQIFFSIIFLLVAGSSVRGLVLNCDYKYEDFHWLGNHFTFYVCEGKVHAMGDMRQIGSVQGNHFMGENLDHVGRIVMTNQMDVMRIPFGLNLVFPNLQSILIMYTGITEVSRDDFQGLPMLRFVNMRNNMIHTIGDNVFECQAKVIEGFNFNDNPIQNIGVHAFDGLDNLKYAHFQSTPCFAPEMSVYPMEYADHHTAMKSIKTATEKCQPPAPPTVPECCIKLGEMIQNIDNKTAEIQAKINSSENQTQQNCKVDDKKSKFTETLITKIDDLLLQVPRLAKKNSGDMESLNKKFDETFTEIKSLLRSSGGKSQSQSSNCLSPEQFSRANEDLRSKVATLSNKIDKQKSQMDEMKNQCQNSRPSSQSSSPTCQLPNEISNKIEEIHYQVPLITQYTGKNPEFWRKFDEKIASLENQLRNLERKIDSKK